MIFDQALEEIAEKYSCFMVEYNFFNHKSPLIENRYLPKRLKVGQYVYKKAGENLAEMEIYIFDPELPYYRINKAGILLSITGKTIPIHTYHSFAKNVLKKWLNSHLHKKNLVDPYFTNIGIGCCLFHDAVNSNNLPRIKITQLFSKVENE